MLNNEVLFEGHIEFLTFKISAESSISPKIHTKDI